LNCFSLFKPWTPEEQRRLEQLLLDFPSEDVEMERWKKIATALGNRTPVQVRNSNKKWYRNEITNIDHERDFKRVCWYEIFIKRRFF
jgi:hypothetical protein